MAEPTLETAQQSLRSLFDLQPDLTSLESVEKLLKEWQPREKKLMLANHPDKVGPENTERFKQIRAEMETLAAFLKKHLEKLKSDRTLASLKQKVRVEKKQKEEEAKRKQAAEEAARLMEAAAEKKRRRQEVLKLVVGGVSFAMCVHSEYIASEDLAKTCSFDRWLYMTKKGKLDKSNADLVLANERASSLESELEKRTLEAKQTAEKLGNLENEIISSVQGLVKKSEWNFFEKIFHGKCGSTQSINSVQEAFRVLHECQAKTRADHSKQCRDLQDMERKMKESESRYNHLQGERDNLLTDCETAKKKLNKLREEWGRREEAHAKESQDLQSQNQSMGAELQDLRSRKQSMDEEIARQKLQLLKRDKEIQDFEQIAGDCARTLKEAGQREEELRHQHDELKKELAERNKKIRDFVDAEMTVLRELEGIVENLEEAVQGKTEAMQREEALRCEHDERKKELLNRMFEKLKHERADFEKSCQKLGTQGTVSPGDAAKSSNDSNDSNGSAGPMEGAGVVRGTTNCDGASRPLPVDPTRASSSQALIEDVRCAVDDWLQERTGVDEGLQLMVLMHELQNRVMEWWRATSQGQASKKSLESWNDSKLGSEAANSKSESLQPAVGSGDSRSSPPTHQACHEESFKPVFSVSDTQ